MSTVVRQDAGVDEAMATIVMTMMVAMIMMTMIIMAMIMMMMMIMAMMVTVVMMMMVMVEGGDGAAVRTHDGGAVRLLTLLFRALADLTALLHPLLMLLLVMFLLSYSFPDAHDCVVGCESMIAVMIVIAALLVLKRRRRRQRHHGSCRTALQPKSFDLKSNLTKAEVIHLVAAVQAAHLAFKLRAPPRTYFSSPR